MSFKLLQNARLFKTFFYKMNKKTESRASLVAQWLGVCLTMQGTRVRAWSGKIPHAAEQLGP